MTGNMVQTGMDQEMEKSEGVPIFLGQKSRGLPNYGGRSH
jgi:hypothetical protein